MYDCVSPERKKKKKKVGREKEENTRPVYLFLAAVGVLRRASGSG